MNVHDRIESVLKGDMPDQVPFTIYAYMMPKGQAERRLRSKGLGFCWRADLVRWEHPNCDIKTVQYRENGVDLSRTIYRTPVGEIHEVNRVGGEYNSSWKVEWPVKSREDYAVMAFVARDAVPVPVFDQFKKTVADVGGDGYVIGHYTYSPLMSIIVTSVGFETAAYHMMDYPDEFWGLYEAFNDKARKGYRVVAKGPQFMMLYGGNVHPAIIGRERFARYVVPCYDELADILHENGKIMGVHLDANNAEWADLVAASHIDVVEAFTPPPDCNLSVADALSAWPDKILSLNFPSSVHLESPDRIRAATLDILAQAGDGSRLIMGITEDIPADCWEKSLEVIADTLNDSGRLPLTL